MEPLILTPEHFDHNGHQFIATDDEGGKWVIEARPVITEQGKTDLNFFATRDGAQIQIAASQGFQSLDGAIDACMEAAS